MEIADRICSVTMEEPGVSKLSMGETELGARYR